MISPKHSGFTLGNFCINQRLSINHEIISACDIGLDIQRLFSVSQESLRKFSIMEWFINCVKMVYAETWLIYDRLLDQQKRKSTFKWSVLMLADIRAVVPQGSILRPHLFLIYVNGLKKRCKLFAYHTSFLSVVREVNTSVSDINKELELISD